VSGVGATRQTKVFVAFVAGGVKLKKLYARQNSVFATRCEPGFKKSLNTRAEAHAAAKKTNSRDSPHYNYINNYKIAAISSSRESSLGSGAMEEEDDDLYGTGPSTAPAPATNGDIEGNEKMDEELEEGEEEEEEEDDSESVCLCHALQNSGHIAFDQMCSMSFDVLEILW
jgi:hypothetical protein